MLTMNADTTAAATARKLLPIFVLLRGGDRRSEGT
jgi:hypothetical protein